MHFMTHIKCERAEVNQGSHHCFDATLRRRSLATAKTN